MVGEGTSCDQYRFVLSRLKLEPRGYAFSRSHVFVISLNNVTVVGQATRQAVYLAGGITENREGPRPGEEFAVDQLMSDRSANPSDFQLEIRAVRQRADGPCPLEAECAEHTLAQTLRADTERGNRRGGGAGEHFA